jgi:hypothetical protein
MKFVISEQLKQRAIDWFNSNAAKNAATNQENKAKKDLQVMVAQATEPVEVPISNEITLKIGDQTFDEFEVDPKKLLEQNPEMFWKHVTFNITDLKADMGDKDYQKTLRPCKITRFKIEKIKRPPQ